METVDLQTIVLFTIGGALIVAIVGILTGLGVGRSVANAIKAVQGDIRFLDTAEAEFLELPDNIQVLARSLLSIADGIDLPGDVDNELRALAHKLTDGAPNEPPAVTVVSETALPQG